MTFKNFPEMVKYILTSTSHEALKHLHFFVSVILVMPFTTADCERSFSAMNLIKTDSRNRLGDILNELMLLYDMTSEETEKIDIKKLAEQVAGSWTYDKTDKTPWSEAYGMCMV